MLLIVLAILFGLFAARMVFLDGTYKDDDISTFAGHLVGSFLIPIFLLIGGLKLLDRA
jgi:hypothetical protein